MPQPENVYFINYDFMYYFNNLLNLESAEVPIVCLLSVGQCDG